MSTYINPSTQCGCTDHSQWHANTFGSGNIVQCNRCGGNATVEAEKLYGVTIVDDRWAANEKLDTALNRDGRPSHAHVSLSRLGGCNYRVKVSYSGKSVYLSDPQDIGRNYRINAAKFLAGEYQSRDSWVIRPWDRRAERITQGERNWQT